MNAEPRQLRPPDPDDGERRASYLTRAMAFITWPAGRPTPNEDAGRCWTVTEVEPLPEHDTDDPELWPELAVVMASGRHLQRCTVEVWRSARNAALRCVVLANGGSAHALLPLPVPLSEPVGFTCLADYA